MLSLSVKTMLVVEGALVYLNMKFVVAILLMLILGDWINVRDEGSASNESINDNLSIQFKSQYLYTTLCAHSNLFLISKSSHVFHLSFQRNCLIEQASLKCQRQI